MKQNVLIVGVCILIFWVLFNVTSSHFNGFIFLLMVSVCFFLIGNGQPIQTQTARSILIKLTMVICIITVLEVAALLHYRIFIQNAVDAPRYSYGRTQYWIEDDELGYKPRPSIFTRAQKEVNNKIVYDTEYTIDSHGLRKTKSAGMAQCNFLFFGGSRVFGEGLPDIQALPYQFSSKLNYNYNVLNYAFHGYGPHQMLRVLETGNLDLSKGNVAVIFYLLAPDDLDKISGNVERFRRGPKYILKEEKLKYVGDLTGIGGIFNSLYDFKSSVISLLRHSQLINLLFKLINSENTEKLDKRYELLLGIINEADKFAREKYNSKFVIILKNEENVGNNILIKLANNNINYIEISKLLYQDWGEHYFLQDGINFNDKVNNELATGLANRYGDCN